MSASQSLALDIRGLSYAYANQWTWSRVVTLKPFDLQIEAGECFGFLGHNGAGKTTTNKCILRLITPRSGSVHILGVDHREAQARSQVGYVPEQPYFYDNLSVQELLELYATLVGVPWRERGAAVRTALAAVHLCDREKSPMRSLSKGLTQRVAMAQAIVGSPKLLLLDEPFSGLDPLGRKEFRELLEGLKAQGVTIFLTSHILSDVEHLCDRVSIMAAGELKGVYSIRDMPSLVGGAYELVIRTASGALESSRYVSREEADQALQAALTQGAAIEKFQFHHGNLEDLFVQVVQSGAVQHG
jgi:ABC-2 type transport system ATP-binding protein